jgi:hypothetical protein
LLHYRFASRPDHDRPSADRQIDRIGVRLNIRLAIILSRNGARGDPAALFALELRGYGQPGAFAVSGNDGD